MKRGQSSVEYLFVVALSLMLIVPASFLFLGYSSSQEDTIVSAQINRIGNEILTKSEEMYVIGNNSWMTLELTLPSNFQNATIYGEKELVIDYFVRTGYTQAVFFSDVNITNGTHRCIANPCSVRLTPGINNVRILSRGDYISLFRS